MLFETRRSGGLFWEAGLTPSGPAGVPFPPDRLFAPAFAIFPNFTFDRTKRELFNLRSSWRDGPAVVRAGRGEKVARHSFYPRTPII